jgi:hypothetical protein
VPPPDESPTRRLPRGERSGPQAVAPPAGHVDPDDPTGRDTNPERRDDLSATGGHLVPRVSHERRERTVREWLDVARLRAYNQAPLLTVWVVVVLAFVRIAMQHWREGTAELGVALLLAAVFRARCDDDRVGLLAIRSRRVDIVTYAVFGLIMVLVSLTITGGPLATR